MNTIQLAKKMEQLGREITIDTMGKARELYEPFHHVEPFEGISIHRDIQYADDERNRLDLFVPVGKANPRPVLIYVHGGGFVAGDKWTPGTPFFDNVGVWSVQNGLIGINMTYRLAPQHGWPSGIEDMHNLVQWIKKNGSDYAIDIERIYFIGHSAGATHVASYIAHPEIYQPDDHGLAGVILMSGIYDLSSMEHNDNTRAYFGDNTALYGQRSPINSIINVPVPIMLVLAEYDPPIFERQTLAMADALQRRDRKFPWFIHLTGQNHLSGILHLGLPGDLLGGRILDFISRTAA